MPAISSAKRGQTASIRRTAGKEIRVIDRSGAYRVIYVARRAEAVFVLHAFQKKTQATSRRHIEISRKRFAQLSEGGK